MKILIAEDGILFREGLKCMLDRESDVTHVSETGDGKEAIDIIAKLHPDIVLVGIYVSSLDGIRVTKEIKSSYPEIGVIILTRAEDSNVIEAIKAGADAFLPKDVRYAELLAAIKSVHQNHSVFSIRSLDQIRKMLQNPSKHKQSNILNERETEVLRLVACGLSNKEIAFRMSLSGRTVSMCLTTIYSKLEVDSRVKAVLLGMQKGWLSIAELPM